MAGGTFDKLVGKVRPGTYVNIKSGKQNTVSAGSRGIVLIPILIPVYGPASEFIKLTAASPDAARAKLGFSIYDKDEGRQMLLIREAFKCASTVYVYIVAEGTAATATSGSLTATAKYGGTRGNSYTVTVAENPVSGFDVTIHLDGTKMVEYEGLTTIEELIAQDCPYITFSGSGDLEAIAGLNLSGGTDAEVSNSDVTAFYDKWESIKFNTVALPTTDSTLQSAAKTKVKYMRENMGKQVQVVMPDATSMDYEGVINVTNSYAIDDDELTHAEACAWVAGATAGATYVQSLTYNTVEGATGVVDAKTHEEAVEAINNGEFFFSISEEETVIVEYDINSLVTFTSGEKDETYRKNRVIRVFDTFIETVQANFPPNKFNNDSTGWEIMKGIGKSILKLFEDAGAITDVDYDADFLIDEDMSEGDETYFNVGLKPVDSAEKLYFSVTTR